MSIATKGIVTILPTLKEEFYKMAKQPNAYKKFVATAATATLVATALAPVASAAPVDSYKDVSKDYKEAVNYLLENGIAQGTSDTTFGTSNNISRGDAAVMIANALKLDTANAKDQGFQDVNSRVEGAVNAIVEAGIASGRTTAKFDPAAYITRQEMAKMLANAYKLTATEKAGFKDVNKNWIDYVSALKENGITLGKSETIFAPEQNLTRGEFALFVFRAENPSADLAIVESVTVVNETTTTAKLKTANKELTAKDFTVLVNGKEVTPTKVESDAKGEVYTITHASLKDASGTVSVNGKQAAFNFVVVEAKVESVKAINSKQIEIKFNTPVKESTVISGGNITNVTLTGVGVAATDFVAPGTTTAELSKDGKTLVVTAQTGDANYFKGKYAVTVPETVTTVDNDAFAAYSSVITATDDVRPTLKGVTYSYNGTNKTATMEFSEPVNIADAVFAFERTDGVALNGATNFQNTAITAVSNTNDTKFVITFDTVNAADLDKDIKVTATGIKDYTGNLATPNPLTTTIKVNTMDSVAPKFVSATVKDNKTLTVKFDEALSATPGATDFMLGATSSTSVTKIDATTYDVGFAADMASGLQTLTLPQVVDVNGNQSDASITKLITINLDKEAPVFQSSKVEKINGKEYLVLTYNENVVPQSGKNVDLTYIKDFVSKTATVSSTSNLTSHDLVDGVSKSVKLDITGLTDSAEYTAKLPVDLVQDLNGNSNVAKTGVVFTRTTNNDAGKPVPTVTVTDNDTVTVAFDKKLDPASALNKANYSIEGATIENVKLTANGTGAATVVLELTSGSSTFTGARTIKISGVKSESGDVMNAYQTTKSLNENVKPTVKSAVLTATDKITLTFSEAVKSTDGDDFVVYVGNDVYTVAGTAGPGKHVEPVITTATKTVVLDLGANVIDATKLSKGVSVKPSATSNVTDSVSNALDLTSVNVSVQ